MTNFGFDGLLKKVHVRTHQEFVFKNFWEAEISSGYQPSSTWTTRETSDGARYEQNQYIDGNVRISTDSRKKAQGHLNLNSGIGIKDSAKHFGVDGAIDIRVIESLELSLSGTLSKTMNDLRFVSCSSNDQRTCSVRSSERKYQLARLNSSFLSFTARATWALSPHLSLQAYAQLFAAQGHYHDFFESAELSGARPYIYRSSLMLLENAGDNDGDGIIDKDFSFATLNANLVLRWEFSPGTTLIFVYTRAEQASNTLAAGISPSLDLGRIGNTFAEEVAIIKLSLFYK